MDSLRTILVEVCTFSVVSDDSDSSETSPANELGINSGTVSGKRLVRNYGCFS